MPRRRARRRAGQLGGGAVLRERQRALNSTATASGRSAISSTRPGSLAAAVGLDPTRDGLTDPTDRRAAEIELNALAATRYRLGKTAFRFLMDTLFMTPRHKDTHAALRDTIAPRPLDCALVTLMSPAQTCRIRRPTS